LLYNWSQVQPEGDDLWMIALIKWGMSTKSCLQWKKNYVSWPAHHQPPW
jgi:hypothetical protein